LLIQGLWKYRNTDFAEAIGAELASSYIVFNTQADINLYKNKFWASLQVQNALDKKYSDILGSPMPGRWWMIGLRWNVTR